jgi:hypothetical protein
VTHNACVLRTTATITATAIVAAVFTLVVPASPSSAVTAIDKADRRGDVKVVDQVDGLDPAVIASIDLRHVTVTKQRDGLRVVVRLKKVLPTPGRWAQMLSFSAFAGDGDNSSFVGAFATLQHVGGASAFLVTPTNTDEEEEEPPTCHVAVTKAPKRVRMEIPYRCVPAGAGTVDVGLLLVDKRNVQEPVVAVDGLRVGGGPQGFPVPFWAGRESRNTGMSRSVRSSYFA